MKAICGDANPKGNVMMIYKGGCRKEIDITEAYRCTGCGGYFHLECIKKHFEMEKQHDVGRNNLKMEIISIIKNDIFHDKYSNAKSQLIKMIKKL